MDKYDFAIQSLKNNPELIKDAWYNPSSMIEGCLFGFCGPDPNVSFSQECPKAYGCLTQIKGKGEEAFSRELTEQIRLDNRIPSCEEDITVDNLYVFAEWQRRLDKEREKLNATNL
jgi:hypothetical protein